MPTRIAKKNDFNVSELFQNRINALYAEQKARHVQLVTDPRYKKLFCAFHPMVECMNSPATHFVRGRTRHQREFIYNIGRHDFDLMIHSNCIKTPYHLRIRMIEHLKTGNDMIKHSETKTKMFENLKSEEIERVYMHHVITAADVALFTGFPSPYASDGTCTFSSEEDGIRVFADYLAHISAHFLQLLSDVE